MVLYIGYFLQYSPGYKNTDPTVEVQCLIAYHYSPVGDHMGNLRHITTLLATKATGVYLQANLLLHPGNCIGSQRVIW